MRIKTSYRLRSYKILEYENGLLWWEAHYDFGMQRSGECLLLGNILILKSWSGEKIGSLVGEFLDPLKKLPSWNKTAYWCFASDLLGVRTGKRLTDDLLKEMASRPEISKEKGGKEIITGPFKLHGYYLSLLEDGSVSWQAPRGNDTVISGKGRIESDILFLGPAMGDEVKQSRQEFLDHLSRLPQWRSTSAWCRLSPLKECREKQPDRSFREVRSGPESKAKSDPFEIPVAEHPVGKSESKERASKSETVSLESRWSSFSGSNIFKGIKFPRPRIKRKKLWATLVLVLSVLIFGISMAFHYLEDRFHRFHWNKEYHHSRIRNVLSFFLIMFVFSVFGFTSDSFGAEEKDMILEESGIHYPGGFDPNTVGGVQGKAFQFWKPEKGPVRFKLVTSYETYIVLTSPPWYWNHQSVRIPEGAEVAVRGSKSVGRDGKLYIIAMEIQIVPSGQLLLFRGKDGIPLWKANAKSAPESKGGLGPSTLGSGASNGAYQHRSR
jgi:hypothetical protein